MPHFSRQTTFYLFLSAAVVFIAIGIASIIYNNTPVDVPLAGTLRPRSKDILTPNMNTGNIADIIVKGSTFNISIKDPNQQLINSQNGISSFHYKFAAKKEGVYQMEIVNRGTSDLTIAGHAKTKGSEIAFAGQMMLVVTGIILAGFSLRLRKH